MPNQTGLLKLYHLQSQSFSLAGPLCSLFPHNTPPLLLHHEKEEGKEIHNITQHEYQAKKKTISLLKVKCLSSRSRAGIPNSIPHIANNTSPELPIPATKLE